MSAPPGETPGQEARPRQDRRAGSATRIRSRSHCSRGACSKRSRRLLSYRTRTLWRRGRAKGPRRAVKALESPGQPETLTNTLQSVSVDVTRSLFFSTPQGAEDRRTGGGRATRAAPDARGASCTRRMTKKRSGERPPWGRGVDEGMGWIRDQRRARVKKRPKTGRASEETSRGRHWTESALDDRDATKHSV